MRMLVTGGSGFIGTNYVEFLRTRGDVGLINLDLRPPRHPAHGPYWRECDLQDAQRLPMLVRDFAPTHVVHLAARTGVRETSLEVFDANMRGVENLLAALAEVPTLDRVIFTSSMLVCRAGYVPRHDTDYQPSTLYGLSKARMEMIIRSRPDLPYAWTIIRPISIWGPWGQEPFESFFRAISRGWFVHVGHGAYRKLFGYVENTAHQLQALLEAPRWLVDRATMYVADTALPLDQFAEAARRALGGPPIRRVPYALAVAAAKLGDLMRVAGWRGVPLTSFRLTNIVTEHFYDISPILRVTAPLPYDLSTAMARTVAWMQRRVQS